MSGNAEARKDPYVGANMMRLDGRPDPYAGMGEVFEGGVPDSPSPRSPVQFNGTFRVPPGASSPRTDSSRAALDVDDHEAIDESDALYDAMPRSRSFVGSDDA